MHITMLGAAGMAGCSLSNAKQVHLWMITQITVLPDSVHFPERCVIARLEFGVKVPSAVEKRLVCGDLLSPVTVC